MKKIILSLGVLAYASGLFGETVILKESEISINGKVIGKAQILTPIDIVSKNATPAKISVKGVVSENYKGQIQKSIKDGEIYVTFDTESDENFKKIKKLEDDYGEIWYEVEGVYEIAADAITTDSDALYAKAKKLYEESCSACHRLHEPNSFTANQWPANLQGMVDANYVALEKVDLDLLTKFLQHNAKEAH